MPSLACSLSVSLLVTLQGRAPATGPFIESESGSFNTVPVCALHVSLKQLSGMYRRPYLVCIVGGIDDGGPRWRM